VQAQIERYFLENEGKNVDTMFTVSRRRRRWRRERPEYRPGLPQPADWSDRKGKENTADAIVARATGAFRNFRDAQVFALVPPRSAASASRPASPWSCRTAAACRATISSPPATSCSRRRTPTRSRPVRLSDLPDVATLKVDIDPGEALRARPRPGRRQFARCRPPGAAATSTTSSIAAA
jgi:multidrug efflux pump